MIQCDPVYKKINMLWLVTSYDTSKARESRLLIPGHTQGLIVNISEK